MVWLEIIVVLGAIFFGIRLGGIGIGLCGGLGLAILTLGFDLQIGSPPVDVILIIMTVVVAASALQAAGGMDYLVRVAGNFMRRNPKYINIIAPIITWSMTIMAGTGFIVFSTLPVIAEVAKESGIRPSRTLAGSVVASQVAISGSPISAAMAAMLTIMEGNGASEEISQYTMGQLRLLLRWPPLLSPHVRDASYKMMKSILNACKKGWCVNMKGKTALYRVPNSQSPCSCWQRSSSLFLPPARSYAPDLMPATQ